MTGAAPPRVFISYSHDSEAHKEQVLDFADRLRADGVDAIIDRYVQSPPQGWPAWCETEIERADFVLMICTETYLRRVRGEEKPGIRHGVLWEARLIRQDVYDASSVSNKYVPVLLSDGSPAHAPRSVRGASIYSAETPEGYEALKRLLTSQPLTPAPPVGPSETLPPRPRRVAEPAQPVGSQLHPRVEDLFVGRRIEREQLASAIFPVNGIRRPVVVSGMPGVGKSYLVDRFYCENMARFPGAYLRLALDPDNLASAADFLATLRDRLKLRAGDGEALAARLSAPLTLVHIENADSFPAGRMVGQLAASLPGCALVISARFRDLGFAAAWGQVPLLPFDEVTALQQLSAELGADAPGQESWPALAAALGHLPLALHLAAGYMRDGSSAGAFLRRLRDRKLPLDSADPADPSFLQRAMLCCRTLSSCPSARYGSRAARTATAGLPVCRRSDTRRLPDSARTSAPLSRASRPKASKTWRRQRPGCPCSTACCAVRAALTVCIRFWLSTSGSALTG